MTTVITFPTGVAYPADSLQEAVTRYMEGYDGDGYDPKLDPGYEQLTVKDFPDISEIDAEFTLRKFTDTESGCEEWLETFGKDIQTVLSFENKYIWTILEGDDGVSRIAPGYHLVNRLAYIITEKAHAPGDDQREWVW